MYTELNAVSKGISLGIFKKDVDRGVDAAKDGSQPYVELMGRRWADTARLHNNILNSLFPCIWQSVSACFTRYIKLTPTGRPLYRSQNGQWRALNNGSPVQPIAAFSYISRAFRQTTSHILGALKLLAESYTPEELNAKARALYAEFRPEVNEWGKRSEISCSKILALRKQRVESLEWVPSIKIKELTPTVSDLEANGEGSGSDNGSPKKKARLLLEEIEREPALDQNTIWDDGYI